MTIKQLIKLCNLWQKRLRLQDWDIRLRFAKQTDFPSKTQVGSCDPMATKKIAYIEILNYDEWKAFHGEEPNIELTLVHELLHVVFNHNLLRFPEKRSIENDLFEQGIDTIATVLLEAYGK